MKFLSYTNNVICVVFVVLTTLNQTYLISSLSNRQFKGILKLIFGNCLYFMKTCNWFNK
jgi:hypothetical protein